jgi:hypothetical protein
LKGELPTGTYLTLGPKPDVLGLLRLAMTADAYRNFIFGNLKSLDKDISNRKFGTDIMSEWNKISPSLKRLETAGRSIPSLNTIWKVRSTSTIAVIMLVVVTMVFVVIPLKPTWLYYVPFYAALIMLAIWGATSQLSSKLINTYLRQHAGKHAADMKLIKEFVQKLLQSLSHYFRQAKVDAAKHPLELYNADYKRIRILKNPGFRRTFKVIIETS